MKKIIMAALMALATQLAAAQNFDGSWNGAIEVNGGKLVLVFNVEDGKCSLKVPAQGASVEAEMKIENGTVKIGIPMIGAKYDGVFMINSIMGTFTQNGMEFPLTLKRGEPVPNRPQTPVGPFPYRTEVVTFANGEASFGGTLTLPEEADSDTIILLMVSGSGQQDRDETLMDHKPFAVIADAFARAGIASLRYDDRGVGASTGDLTIATTDTFAADALAGLKYLRSLGYKKVGLLGHSEGGTIAFMLASGAISSEAISTPDFIISMAGMAENGEATLLAQIEKIAIAQGLPEAQAGAYAKQAVASTKATANPWMEHFLKLDPAPYISKVTCPALVINGEKDLQVIAERNIPIIKKLLSTATIKTYPDLNHLFQHCQTGNPTEYYGIEETISTEVLADMVNWIKMLSL